MRRLLVLAAGVLATAPSAGAATIDVTVADDLLAGDGRCSLREAISSADNDASPFGGAGECVAGSGDDTVNLPTGTFKLSIANAPLVPDENLNATGDLDATSNMTIQGAGASLTTIDANGTDRVLDVLASVSLAMQGLTITGGHAPDGSPGGDATGGDAGNSDPGGGANGGAGPPGESGGGIRNAGSLTVGDSVISHNVAGAGGLGGNAHGGAGGTPLSGSGGDGGDAGAGAGGHGGDGGGIFSAGTLTLLRVTIASNAAGAGGHGGTGTGGQAGFGTNGQGGSGGNGIGGSGGDGGTGGGVASVGGSVTLDLSSISANAAGTGGIGGLGEGGLGGGGTTLGRVGGLGSGGSGGDGGAGGLFASVTATVSRSLFDGNGSGAGGDAGAGTGADGGDLLGSSGSAGPGAAGFGGFGGDGGRGAGALTTAPATFTNVTVVNGSTGAGGKGGAGTGGDGGGLAFGTGTRGAGGDAHGRPGGKGGSGAGLATSAAASVTHATITLNTLGGGGAGGTAHSGTGVPPGSPDSGSPGAAGANGALLATSDTALVNSIVAGNGSPACSTHIIDGGFDLSLADPSCPGADADPLLGPLSYNGGPTLTRRPVTESPTRDAVPVAGAGCALTDQRGVDRPHGGACEIGAYEVAPPDVTLTAAAATATGTVNPNARSTTYHFEFGPTTTYGSATPDATLQPGLDPVAVSAALSGLTSSTAYHVRLVATNGDGTSASPDATFTTGATADTTAPVFLSASVKPKKFKRKHGTTCRYRLSENARVVFTLQRKKGKRYVRAKKFTKASKAGANKKKFVTRRLKPGRYRATLVATDAAKNRSKAKRLTFRIKR